MDSHKQMYKIQLTSMLLAVFVTVVALTLGAYQAGRQDQLHDMRTTYTTCQADATSTQCREAQTNTSTEYLCDANSTNCWVEVK